MVSEAFPRSAVVSADERDDGSRPLSRGHVAVDVRAEVWQISNQI